MKIIVLKSPNGSWCFLSR